MIDTIISVKARDGRRPGFVQFSGAGEISTFSDAAIKQAEGLVGQRVEYTIEEKPNPKGGNPYRNLASVKPAGGDATPQGVTRGRSDGSLDTGGVESQLKRIADGIEVVIRLLSNPMKLAVGAAASVVQAAADSLEAREQKLAGKVGKDAASAMVNAIQAKHPGDESKQKAALDALLAAHGIAR